MLEIVARHLDAIDGVYFDFGGVVVHAPTADNWAVLDYCESQGIERQFALEEISQMRRAVDAGDMALTECYRLIAEKAGVTPEPGFADKAVQLDGDAWTNIADETWSLMLELKAAGKKVGVLSNMSRDFFARHYCKAAAHVHALCDAEVISAIDGFTKPNPAIYALAAKKIGCEPGRLLFLDDIQRNVDAARACGWRAERYALDTQAALR